MQGSLLTCGKAIETNDSTLSGIEQLLTHNRKASVSATGLPTGSLRFFAWLLFLTAYLLLVLLAFPKATILQRV